MAQPQLPAEQGIAITAVMPAFNCAAHLAQTLPQLLKMQSRGDLLEVIVVDDGSSDETAALATRLGATVIPSGGHRRGPGAARNEGARYARGNVLWFVDADVIAKMDGPKHIRQALETDDVVAVFGSYDDTPAAKNLLSQYKNLAHHYYHHTGHRQASTFWAGCGSVRKGAFMAIDGFDGVRFPKPSIEDIELGYRLSARGGRILLCREFQGTHLKEWRLRNLLETDIFQRAIPWSRLLVAGEGGKDLNASVAEELRAMVACAAIVMLFLAIAGTVPFTFFLAVLTLTFSANFGFFILLARRKGVLFALFGLAFHQLYYLYSATSYVGCWIEARIRPRGRALLSLGRPKASLRGLQKASLRGVDEAV